MVEKLLLESFDAEVIKVTIKGKPEPERGRAGPEPRLRSAFEILKLHALQERRVRQLRGLLEEQASGRRLRRCFDGWRARARAARKPARPSSEARIELLVSAIAERQREILDSAEKPRKSRENQAGPTTGRASGNAAPPAPKLEPRNRVREIREQRAKLEEERRQVQEIKLRELDQAVKQSSRTTIQVAKQALGQCDPRTRRGIIHLMREQGCRDKSAIEIPRIPSPPRFLMRMETRAEERKQRMKQAEDVRRRRREEQKKRDEMRRLEAEEEQRQQQIAAQKEAKKVRREQELKRLKEIERNRGLEQLADQCYKRCLFRRYILKPLSSIVEEKLEIMKMARRHYEETLLCKIFYAWKGEWIEQLDAKLQLADKLYRHNLLWYHFDEWRTLAFNAKQQYQVAIDFYDMNLQRKCMKGWRLLCVRIKIKTHEQEVKAKKHYEKHLKKISFNIWKRYMSIADDINESEQRRDEWRDLIKKFIPDTPKMRRASLNF